MRAMDATSTVTAPPVRLTPEAFAKHAGGVRRTAINLLASLREIGADVSVSPLVDGRVTMTSATPRAPQRAALQLWETAYFASRPLHGRHGVVHSLYYDQQFRLANWPLVVT